LLHFKLFGPFKKGQKLEITIGKIKKLTILLYMTFPSKVTSPLALSKVTKGPKGKFDELLMTMCTAGCVTLVLDSDNNTRTPSLRSLKQHQKVDLVLQDNHNVVTGSTRKIATQGD
jgi:hypothetical protein